MARQPADTHRAKATRAFRTQHEQPLTVCTLILRVVVRRTHLSFIRRRLPGTFVVTIITLGVALALARQMPDAHRALVDTLGVNRDDLRHWRIWTLPFETLVQADPGLSRKVIGSVGLTAIGLGALEYRVGTRAALAMFFVADWLAALLRVPVLAALAAAGIGRARLYLDVADTGSSVAAYAALAAACTTLSGRHRTVALTLLLGWLCLQFTFERFDVPVAHLIGWTLGTAAGAWWSRRGLRSRLETD